jgi:hypothetical protein
MGTNKKYTTKQDKIENGIPENPDSGFRKLVSYSDGFYDLDSNGIFRRLISRNDLSAQGSINYDPNTGIFSYNESVSSVNGQTGNVLLTTTHINEGINLYFTTQRARESISIKSDSQNHLIYNSSTGELGVKALAIISTTIDDVAEDISEFVTSNYTGTEFQEGDLVILNAATDANKRTYIHNGGTASDITDFSLINGPELTDTYIRGLFSNGNGLGYNPTTGLFFLEADIEDLENVSITSAQINDVLKYNGSEWINAPADITGSGTTNFVSKWTSASAQGDSQIFDDGTSVGINKSTGLTAKLHILSNAAQDALRVDTNSINNVLLAKENGRVLVRTAVATDPLGDEADFTVAGVNGEGSKFFKFGNRYMFTHNGENGILEVGNPGTPLKFGTHTAKDLIFVTGNVEAVRIKDNGSVVINQLAPDASAIFDVVSTTKGVLLPRMTATQASAITPVEGLELFATTINSTFTEVGKYIYTNATWKKADRGNSVVSVGADLSGTITLDLSLGNYFHFSVNGNFTLAFSNLPNNTVVYPIYIEITKDNNSNTRTITYPASVKGDVKPASLTTANQLMQLGLTTRDGGTTYLLTVLNYNAT